MGRKAVPVNVVSLVLHEAGYMCSNPRCRWPVSLELHHLHQVSEGGGNEPSNLLCLCANCHSQHHAGIIPDRSLQTWKHLLLTLNAAYDRASVDTLLALHKLGELGISGDALLTRAGLLASGLIEIGTHAVGRMTGLGSADALSIRLSAKGRAFVEAWLDGREDDALRAVIPHN